MHGIDGAKISAVIRVDIEARRYKMKWLSTLGEVRLHMIVGDSRARIVDGLLNPGAEPNAMRRCVRGKRN